MDTNQITITILIFSWLLLYGLELATIFSSLLDFNRKKVLMESGAYLSQHMFGQANSIGSLALTIACTIARDIQL